MWKRGGRTTKLNGKTATTFFRGCKLFQKRRWLYGLCRRATTTLPSPLRFNLHMEKKKSKGIDLCRRRLRDGFGFFLFEGEANLKPGVKGVENLVWSEG